MDKKVMILIILKFGLKIYNVGKNLKRLIVKYTGYYDIGCLNLYYIVFDVEIESLEIEYFLLCLNCIGFCVIYIKL